MPHFAVRASRTKKAGQGYPGPAFVLIVPIGSGAILPPDSSIYHYALWRARRYLPVFTIVPRWLLPAA